MQAATAGVRENAIAPRKANAYPVTTGVNEKIGRKIRGGQ
jgi:hypothetical protein